MNRKTLHCCTL